MEGKQKTLNKNLLYNTCKSKYFLQLEEFIIINPLELNKPKYLRVKSPSSVAMQRPLQKRNTGFGHHR